jgi:GntR family transcriptional regulator/MocR family aminotransferase
MALAVLEIRNWAADVGDRDDPLLIEQIQARLLPRRGIFANPDEIIVTLGAQNALYMLATLLMSKGSKVAMEDPGYPDARSIFRLAGAEITPTPVDTQGIVTSAIPTGREFRVRDAEPPVPDDGPAQRRAARGSPEARGARQPDHHRGRL